MLQRPALPALMDAPVSDGYNFSAFSMFFCFKSTLFSCHKGPHIFLVTTSANGASSSRIGTGFLLVPIVSVVFECPMLVYWFMFSLIVLRSKPIPPDVPTPCNIRPAFTDPPFLF